MKTQTICHGECVLVGIQGREFFLHKKNLPYLVELTKTLNARLCIVKVKKAKLLSLEEFCVAYNKGVTPVGIIYELVKEIPLHKNPLKEKHNLKALIRREFLNGHAVSVKGLSETFLLSKSTLRYYLAAVKEEMTNEGYAFTQLSRGNFTAT